MIIATRLATGLQRAFAGADLPALFLLANPTAREVAARAAQPAGDDDAAFMNLEAVVGLRSLLGLWIVRAHLTTCTRREHTPRLFVNDVR